jgi:hypothetical protein
MLLLLDALVSSPLHLWGRMTLVDDLDMKGERALSAFSCESVRRRQYMEAMHLTISSDILLGHWYR